jgi:hypothetical protein
MQGISFQIREFLIQGIPSSFASGPIHLAIDSQMLMYNELKEFLKFKLIRHY